MLTDDIQNNYTTNHNGNDLCYGELISYLFKHALGYIQKKYELRFPINTLDAINTQDQIAMVLYDYADPFMITDGTCNLQNKINTSLNNNIRPNVMDLEYMSVCLGQTTLLFFGSKIKFAMNGFISWYL